jgi:hypothetical protein
MCRYVRYWTAVKTRWHLSVTLAEKLKLRHLAANCTNARLAIRKAAVSYH